MRYMITLTCVLILALVKLWGDDKPDAKATVPAVGNWQGTLRIGAVELRLGVSLTAGEDGTLKGTWISIDQGSPELPINKVTYSNRELNLAMPNVAASYTGTLNEKGDEFAGTFVQGPNKFPLKFKKVERITRLNRPQEPKPPFLYQVEDVSYENKQAKVKIAGTLTMPKGTGPFPVVLLISGSGPQDRDESLLGHKPFMVLADALTRRGVAVLRVDDRGVGKSTGSFLTATSFDFADDVLTGVEYLKTRKEVDRRRIGLIGHSEGGIIAPIVASKSSDVAFIVLMAGTGLPGEDIIRLQGRLIAKASGAKDEELERGEAIQKKLYALIKSEQPSNELVTRLKAMMQEELKQMTADEKKSLEKVGGMAAIQAQFATFAYPWFKTFLFHDPRPVLGQVRCPVLAINGELDLQVPYKENLDAIRNALVKTGHHTHTIKSFPKLNHLFQQCTTGVPSEYGKIEETINEEVLKTICEWVLAQSAQK